ncbi:MAG: type I restriction endonuclease subunit R [Gomphosphaeria aponina SAG 52.96 = DSM 107014]|uniref:Type I restriction enzyme endonuclease subunit n=1 Tax=Gomphosphaeria aponina SAG 52.96 = DSM 107014 TaxID=1521640 RepID=A0A941JSY6_9CHRO|nr:type I restriction endonuclease subunit R [Gomphosphaeria aponina SAG 52.96 = DSM 107014]
MTNQWLESIISQIPAIALLQNMGYEYLTPQEALAKRGGKPSRIVLEEILTTQLQKLNQIQHRGKSHSFSEINIKKAVAAISQFPYEAVYTTSQKLYDLLTLGKSLEQIIDGDKKSYPLQYIDWQNPANNLYHVTDEFKIECRNSTQTRRPDLVLFVNGIPLVVIECKRPDIKDPLNQAINQQLDNHNTDEIPHFFCLTQLLLVISQNAAKYGTTATDKKFWAVWKEETTASEQQLYQLINTPLPPIQQEKLLSGRAPEQQQEIQEIWAAGDRQISPQDRTLFSLLTPQRLLELISSYIVFDNGTKKIARYQQYFAVKATLEKVKKVRSDLRQGGVIWHTTGSGKSLTMVMLAKALAMEKTIINPKIILVNDRIDLDEQLKNTFKNCGVEIKQAKNGNHLLKLVNHSKAEIITTVIDKFETVAREKGKNESRDIFVLVDESHRSQYGQNHARMKTVFPHACYIGFTGTPLLKKEKNTALKFGGFIHSYTMPKAVADQAVVPLLYEGRESEFKNTQAVDKWFERITEQLNEKQKADLKRKFKTAEPLYEAESRMAEIAYDISEHFYTNFKGKGLKGQFATSSKRAAIKYKKLLEQWGKVRAEVIISPPDTREDKDSVNEADISEVQGFWKDMMSRYGTAEKYQETIINKFKDGENEPEILIVVDKLLTGFDAPRNAVLYVDKRLKEHNILQAIARVNRVFEGKDYGLIIDYRGIFGEMNNALDIYAKLEQEGFERNDIIGALVNVQVEIDKLPTYHAAVWDIFQEVANKKDPEAMEKWLYPQDRRDGFYEALRDFVKTLQLALSNPHFQETTPEATKKTYTQDLKYFSNLRTAVKQRYGETVDYSSYETQIINMVLKQIGAEEVKTIIEPVDIFELQRFEAEINSIAGEAAQADAIAARIKKVIAEKMAEDPVLYLRLSELIEQAINNHRANRLSDLEYLKLMQEYLETARNGDVNSIPPALQQRKKARAYYNVLKEKLTGIVDNQELLVNLATAIDDIIINNQIRDWHTNQDIQNDIRNGIDDLVVDELKKTHNLCIPWQELDEMSGKIINIAKHYESN